MLYTVTTKTPKRKKDATKAPYKYRFTYHVFIINAKSDKEITEKFKASWPEHRIVDILVDTSNIVEV